MTILPLALASLLTVNFWTLLRFRDDKRRAVAGKRRVPERDLLTLALFGGTPAAFLARHLFRHKTRKQPFSTYLQLVAMVQLGAIAGLAWTFAI
ncbi:DUF1294 domain-containing protein [Sphingomonas xinjiangensis]|uniref:Uncharacterized membrane protein YsdA (DUF1294 family) n=1 Tax=Sphingomonas xinjiangensis TaxID=643568 RepID=A0A840YQQ6_9SPHN|nr:DUF1294 domain-containing protein [Sphingomonas xinjiangensis]MBB5711441.1 uncharacterized membrane protein YsdA (DUF1294 family) [Sphingomonas xinjiangensis]